MFALTATAPAVCSAPPARQAPRRSSGPACGAAALQDKFLGSAALLSQGRPAARCLASSRRAVVVASAPGEDSWSLSRRDLGAGPDPDAIAAAVGTALLRVSPAHAYDDDDIRLITEEMEKELENVPMVTTASGLQYKDVKVGRGPNPPRGFQVTVKYVAMVPKDPFGKKPGPRVFDSSIEKKKPYDIRLGTASVIPGLDEGIMTMKMGGLRRMYIPGELSFPNGLVAAPGRPRVPPASPVIFDVELLLIPGFDEYDDDDVIPEVDTAYTGFGADGA